MIQQQKTYRFSDNTVITKQNIRKIGELIALSSVRTRMIHSTRDLYYVFQRLYKDIYCHTDILKPYSEAYDYAEEAICFLCRFIGKKLGDLCIGKFGKPLPIRLACYRHLGRILWKKYNKNAKYEVGSYEDQNLRHNELTIDPYAKQATEEASYERYDKLIAKMALPDYEYETLLAMMNTKRSIFIKYPSIKSGDVIFFYPNCALQYSLGFIFELLYSVYFFSLKITNVYLRLE